MTIWSQIDQEDCKMHGKHIEDNLWQLSRPIQELMVPHWGHNCVTHPDVQSSVCMSISDQTLSSLWIIWFFLLLDRKQFKWQEGTKPAWASMVELVFQIWDTCCVLFLTLVAPKCLISFIGLLGQRSGFTHFPWAHIFKIRVLTMFPAKAPQQEGYSALELCRGMYLMLPISRDLSREGSKRRYARLGC